MDERFHPAQAALASGDVAGMAALLAADPQLAAARSQRSHPTLLQCLVLTMPPVDALEDLIDLLARRGAELTDPLIASCSMDNVRGCTKLLDLGADIKGNVHWSPLEEALYWGQAACVELLLERGAAVANLRTAAGLGDLDYIARCFDARGALTAAAGEIAWPFWKHSIPEAVRRDRQQIVSNALVYAAAWGRTEAVELLLGQGAPIDLIPAGFDYAGTPLHYAALNGRREMVDQLLRRGADAALPDRKIGKLPEDWARHGGHEELAEYLRGVRQSASSGV
jgi:ankyrin repeat protein